MPELQAQPVGTLRVEDKGKVTVPAAYRKRHKISKGSEVVCIQLGEALMIVPADVTLQHLCQRIQSGLAGQGVSVEQAVKNLGKIRQRRFKNLYGGK